MSGMVFSDAWVLWILLPLWGALAAAWIFLRRRERRGAAREGASYRTTALAYPSVAAAARLDRPWRARLRSAVQGMRWVTLFLLVLAMARPQIIRGIRPRFTQGIDIMLAIDTSGSMRALDLDANKPIPERRNRLEVVKDVVGQFVAQRPSDQLGLVVFGADAFLQCPLTLDHGLLSNLLGRVEIGSGGADATAIGSGLGVAVKRLEASKAKSKVVILLTDGLNNAGVIEPRKAAEIARALGVRVYTIGAGSHGKAPFLVDQPFFGKQVAYGEVSIDEETLRGIAEATGGAYFRAEDAQGLAAIYDQIGKMEKSAIHSPAIVDRDERAGGFIAVALALLVIEIALLATALRRVP